MKTVHVAVGIVTNARGAVLIARRPSHIHQGGLWEFPGGKVEMGETVETALWRELREEIGIDVQTANAFLQVEHAYSDKTVLLDVWQVTAYQGQPHAREGQPLVWVMPTEMDGFAFPAADEPIIAALLAQIAQHARSKAISALHCVAR